MSVDQAVARSARARRELRGKAASVVPRTVRRATRVPQEGVSKASARVAPDHGWPQLKACSRASLEGSQAPDHTDASGGPRSGMAPRSGPARGSPGERVSHHASAGGVADRGADIQIVQPLGAPSGCPPRDPLRGKLADATGYPLPASRPAAEPHLPRAISVPLRAVNHGQQRYPRDTA